MNAYLDHNATAPLRPEAREAMAAALDLGANPSSVHGPGRRAHAALEGARERVAKRVCARAEDIVFTSGGTEADNLAVHSAAASGSRRLMISATEHDAVIEAAQAAGVAVDLWPVRPDGIADLDWLSDRLRGWDRARDGAPFAALMAANNETGVIQPVEQAGRMIREADGLFLVDAVQAPGRIGFDVAGSLAHYAALSAHKLGGPQGAGALALACDAPITRLAHGGGQEKGRRCGTPNLAGASGFAAALEAAEDHREVESGRLGALQTRLERRLTESGARVWGAHADRLPNTTCITAPGWPSEIQVIAMDLAGFAVSAGAACSSGKVGKSRVLEAMGASEDEAGCALRISTGPGVTDDQIDAFCEAWNENYARVRPRAAALAG